MVPALKSSDHTIKCACGNCDAVLLLHAEDAQAIATTPQKQLLIGSQALGPSNKQMRTHPRVAGDGPHEPRASHRDGLAGWAYRIRTAESGRGLPDWICVTTWPEVGASPAAETLRVRAA